MTLQNGLARPNKQSKTTSDELGEIFAFNNRHKMFKFLADLQIRKEKHQQCITKRLGGNKQSSQEEKGK